MKVLLIGDIVGKTGRDSLGRNLPELKKKYNPDVIIANGENAAGGAGITEEIFRELRLSGVDIVTGGNHTWDQKDIFEFIDNEPCLLRPANYPEETTPGNGSVIYEAGKSNTKVAVINLIGRVFMKPVDCPFKAADREIKKVNEEAEVIIIDFHAEATSEKQAMGWHLNGRVSAVIGTHSHVQTADERLLPGNTAYITDVGMTGLYNSILGVDIDGPLERFTTGLPNRLHISGGKSLFNAVVITVNEIRGEALSIERIFIIN
ncbi:MAG: TIGR00282 family metallophosphoesterase [Firmicutes bacterium]|nr:TIGR00282 family metallophosphoesterase [Bacillota bacterium]